MILNSQRVIIPTSYLLNGVRQYIHIAMETKQCSWCLQLKPAIEYRKGRGECNECQKEKQRDYYDENRELINARNRVWKQEHNQQVLKCECGCDVTRGYMAKHKKTKKHKDMVEGKVVIRKVVLSYYDEEENFKRKFLYVLPEVENEFKSLRSIGSNYKILKHMNLI